MLGDLPFHVGKSTVHVAVHFEELLIDIGVRIAKHDLISQGRNLCILLRLIPIDHVILVASASVHARAIAEDPADPI